jgi:hypothetical protein
MGRVMWYSSWNFTPDPRGKILTNKPSPGIFLYPVSVLIIRELKLILIIL